MLVLYYQGVIADKRMPDVIRIAPVPMYNTFTDAWDVVAALRTALSDSPIPTPTKSHTSPTSVPQHSHLKSYGTVLSSPASAYVVTIMAVSAGVGFLLGKLALTRK
jgi:hypothetical protein